MGCLRSPVGTQNTATNGSVSSREDDVNLGMDSGVTATIVSTHNFVFQRIPTQTIWIIDGVEEMPMDLGISGDCGVNDTCTGRTLMREALMLLGL